MIFLVRTTSRILSDSVAEFLRRNSAPVWFRPFLHLLVCGSSGSLDSAFCLPVWGFSLYGPGAGPESGEDIGEFSYALSQSVFDARSKRVNYENKI